MENNNIEMSFISTTTEELSTIPVVDGQIIAISNGNGFYYDLGGVRRQVSGDGSVTLDSLSADLGELFGTSTGPNLLNPTELELNKQVDIDGTIKNRSINVITTGYIAVEEGKTYYYSRNGVIANDDGNSNGYKLMYNAAYDENHSYIEGSYNEGRCPSLTVPAGAKYIRITFYDTVGRVNEEDGSNNSLNYFITEGFQLEKGKVTAYKPYGAEIVIIPSVEELEKALEDLTDRVNDNTSARESRWKDKTILWLGTSIPAGKDSALNSEGTGKSYPEMVGERLGANVINMSLGSSMIRANVRTGDYVGGKSDNILRSLTQTEEEKLNLINNWSTLRLNLSDPDKYTSFSEDNETTIKNYSFENMLLPYLNDTYPMPDLFVIDHGHNDWKYKLSNNKSNSPSDILLEPTSSNISSGLLAEDTYMTANNNENLIKFFGDLSKISDTYRNEFINSVNRNCYIGAVNFICTLILHYNPRARIVFIGNLDSWQKENLTEAQVKVADSWAFPIIKVWEKLGFGGHFIPGTATSWGGTSDLRQKWIYCKDKTHPHSDSTGESMQMYADIIADELNRCV